MDIDELYDIDDNEGIIVNKRFGQRSFFLGANEWNSLIEKLHGTFSSGAAVILYDIGKSYGASSLEREKAIDADLQLTIDLLSRESRVAGWGKVGITRTEKGFAVRIQRCVFCSASGNHREIQIGCFFVKGVIAGFAELLFGSGRFNVEEIHCGKDYCEFVVILSG